MSANLREGRAKESGPGKKNPPRATLLLLIRGGTSLEGDISLPFHSCILALLIKVPLYTSGGV